MTMEEEFNNHVFFNTGDEYHMEPLEAWMARAEIAAKREAELLARIAELERPDYFYDTTDGAEEEPMYKTIKEIAMNYAAGDVLRIEQFKQLRTIEVEVLDDPHDFGTYAIISDASPQPSQEKGNE